MSYDIHINDSEGRRMSSVRTHRISGGTYAMNGTTELWLNITYNYAPHFYRLMGEDGIRSIYGKRVADTLPGLRAAADQLGDDRDDDYWKPTEGNAKAALYNLIALGEMAPEGFWDGD